MRGKSDRGIPQLTRGRTLSGRIVMAAEAEAAEAARVARVAEAAEEAARVAEEAARVAEAAEEAARVAEAIPDLNQAQSIRRPSGRLPVFEDFAPSPILPQPTPEQMNVIAFIEENRNRALSRAMGDFEGGYTQIKKRKYTRTGKKKQHRRRRRRHSTRKHKK